MQVIETTFYNDDNIIKQEIDSILRYKIVYTDIMYQKTTNGGYFITLYYSEKIGLGKVKMFFDNIIEVYYFLRGIEKTVAIIYYNKKEGLI